MISIGSSQQQALELDFLAKSYSACDSQSEVRSQTNGRFIFVALGQNVRQSATAWSKHNGGQHPAAS